MTSIRAIRIDTDGQVEELSLPARGTGEELCKIIGCALFEAVTLSDGITFFVDDFGIHAGAVVNLPATILSHLLGTNTVLLGTVVAVGIDAGGNTVGLTGNQMERLTEAVNRKPDTATVEALAESLAPFPHIVRALRR